MKRGILLFVNKTVWRSQLTYWQIKNIPQDILIMETCSPKISCNINITLGLLAYFWRSTKWNRTLRVLDCQMSCFFENRNNMILKLFDYPKIDSMCSPKITWYTNNFEWLTGILSVKVKFIKTIKINTDMYLIIKFIDTNSIKVVWNKPK